LSALRGIEPPPLVPVLGLAEELALAQAPVAELVLALEPVPAAASAVALESGLGLVLVL
jgi:hypothetical protein